MENNSNISISLENLYSCLKSPNHDVLSSILSFGSITSDLEDALKKMYTMDKAYVKVSKLDNDVKGSFKYDEIYDNYVEGYEQYKKEFFARLKLAFESNQKASYLFYLIVTLPSPQREIIYRKYINLEDNKTIIDRMFLTRSTFYRALASAKKVLSVQMIAKFGDDYIQDFEDTIPREVLLDLAKIKRNTKGKRGRKKPTLND